MKATGIVRRIDDLGRVVIPKEIRRTQMIRVGDPLEIFVSANGEVVFKKYSPVGEMSPLAATCVETVYKIAGVPLAVTDRDHTVAAAGAGREALEKPLHTGYVHLIEQRRAWQGTPGPGRCVTAHACRRRPWRPFWRTETLWALWRWFAAGRRPAKKRYCWQNSRQHCWAASWRAETFGLLRQKTAPFCEFSQRGAVFAFAYRSSASCTGTSPSSNGQPV